MAEEAPKRKINFKKIALFGLGPIVLLGIGLGAGAFLFAPTQSPVEQVEDLIEKKTQTGRPTPEPGRLKRGRFRASKSVKGDSG
jgi:flagellar FliL protein